MLRFTISLALTLTLLLTLSASVLAQWRNVNPTITAPTVSDLQQLYVGHKAYLNLSTINCLHTIVDVVSITAIYEPVPTTTNALGEQVPTSSQAPRVNIVVRCPDGHIGEFDVLQHFVNSALLPPDALSPAEQTGFQSKVQALMGKTLYSLDSTVLYPITSTLADLEFPPAKKLYLARGTPMLVTASKTWNSRNKTLALLKLSSTTGEFFVVLSAMEGSETVTNPILGQLTTVPVTCGQLGGKSDREVIRCERGTPDKINDYGRGGEQWVYSLSGGGEELIYFTPDGKYEDRQILAP